MVNDGYQWEIFGIQYMELLYHIVGHMNCGDIPWNLGKIGQTYMESVPPINRFLRWPVII